MTRLEEYLKEKLEEKIEEYLEEYCLLINEDYGRVYADNDIDRAIKKCKEEFITIINDIKF